MGAFAVLAFSLLTAQASPVSELVLKGHTSEVVQAGFSRDGSRVVTASWDQTGRIWDAGAGPLPTPDQAGEGR